MYVEKCRSSVRKTSRNQVCHVAILPQCPVTGESCHVSAATLKLFGILPMIPIGLEPMDGEWSTDG